MGLFKSNNYYKKINMHSGCNLYSLRSSSVTLKLLLRPVTVFILLVSGFINVNAQQVKLNVNGFNSQKVFLYSVSGEKTQLIDAIKAKTKNVETS